MKYIGIDIGDGESAVAVLEEDSIIEPVIEYIDGRGSILSVVGMSGTDVLIGEKALIDRHVVHLRSRFKSRYLTNPDSERDIERFAHGLKSALLNEEEDFFSGDITVAVGCPAGWKEDDRKKYRDILKKAAYICEAFLAIVIVLTVALAISKIAFYILFYAIYAVVAFVVAIFWVKMMSKILHYIEQRKKSK